MTPTNMLPCPELACYSDDVHQRDDVSVRVLSYAVR